MNNMERKGRLSTAATASPSALGRRISTQAAASSLSLQKDNGTSSQNLTFFASKPWLFMLSQYNLPPVGSSKLDHCLRSCKQSTTFNATIPRLVVLITRQLWEEGDQAELVVRDPSDQIHILLKSYSLFQQHALVGSVLVLKKVTSSPPTHLIHLA